MSNNTNTEFKLGDAVVIENNAEFSGLYLTVGRNLQDIKNNTVSILDNFNIVCVPLEQVRHATEEELENEREGK